MEKNWYIARTKPNKEKKLRDFLNKFGIDHYLPIRTSLRKWSDRIKKIESPLIQGYLFVNSDNIGKNKAFESGYCFNFLMQEKKHVVLKEEEISLLKQLEKYEGEIITEQRKIEKGELVEIISGALKGVKGMVNRDSELTEMYIDFSVLETGFVVHVEKNRIKKLDRIKNNLSIVQ